MGSNRNAYARYVQILGMRQPLCQEAAELAGIVADLQLTPEEVDADRAVVARFHELSAVWAGKMLAANEQRHRENLRDEAQKRHANEIDEHSRAIQHSRLRVEACDQAAAPLERLKAEHPELFDTDGHPARLITAAAA